MTDITALKETPVNTKRIIGGSEKMESIFHTVEMIRGDLTQCGREKRRGQADYSIIPFFKKQAGFWIDEELYQYVLNIVRE